MPPENSPSTRKYGSDPINPYRFWHLRFWHGMSKPAWLRLIWKNKFAVSPSRLPIALSIEVVTTLNSVGGLLQDMFLGHVIRQKKLAEPPLFVIGHWRSGTTLLHELLIRDPEHTYANTFECFSPAHFAVTETMFVPWTRWLLPKKRPMDNMATGWDRPQEDEFALANLGVPSPYLVWAFPNHGPVYDDYLDLRNVSEEDRTKWKQTLEHFVQCVSFLRNKRIVLKSPTHTARIKTLLEIFPDAKFIHIVRDPLALFPSTVRLWRSLGEVQGLQNPSEEKLDEWLEESVLATLTRMYDAFEQDRELIPAGNLAEVRYEDLVAVPKKELQRLYGELNLGPFKRIESALDEYLAEIGDYKTNTFELPDEVEAKVRERWREYFERYGY